MRKLLMVLLISIMPMSSHAQLFNVFKMTTNLAFPVFGLMNGAVDFRLGTNFSMGMNLMGIDQDDDGQKQEGHALGGRFSFYPTGVFKNSLFVRVEMGMMSSEVTEDNGALIEADGNYYGFVIGYQWYAAFLTMNAGVGLLGFTADYATITGTATRSDSPIEGNIPYIDFSVGLAF
jgi:hypothetical protein